MAVYTRIDPETLARFLDGYDIGQAKRFEGILQGIENSNYALETSAGRYVLTVFEKRAKAADLPYFLGLKVHLADKGYPAPRPIERRDGAVLGEVHGKPAAIVTFLDGDWPPDPSAADARAAGAALADLHLAGADFGMRRANDLGVDAWQALFDLSRDQADTVRPGLAGETQAALEELIAGWPRDLPKGASHLDLFPDNLFLDDAGAVSGVIDFYFAGDEAYAYDLAIMLNAWCFDADGRWRECHRQALVAGYESRRPLSPEERAALPILLAGAAMRFFLTRLYDWLHPEADALVWPKDPLQQFACLAFHRSRI